MRLKLIPLLVLSASILLGDYIVPTLTTECDGYTYSPTCMTRFIVYFVWEPPYGFVAMTRMLEPNPYVSSDIPQDPITPDPPPILVIDSPPIDTPDIPPPPTVTPTPEPAYQIALLLASLGLLVKRICA